MINAASSKFVLLLGRFTGPQRAILDDVLAPGLTRRNYIPAGLSHFVIADLTDARSTPLESQLLAPMLAIPFFPLVRRGDRVFSMFMDLQHKYPWVQPARTYRGRNHLEQPLAEWIIPTAEREATKWNRRKRVR